MTTCITTTVLDPRSIYPVGDPRRCNGLPPFTFGYLFALDAVQVDVSPTPGLSRCRMVVTLVSTLTEPKEIQAVNLATNVAASTVQSVPLGVPASMTVRKAGTGGQSCGSGVDTLVLCRDYVWPQGRTALYTFDPTELWDLWGGCTVTFTWVRDDAGSGKWGNQTPPPVYPQDLVPGGTLMIDATGNGFDVIFGGAAFAADQNYISRMGVDVRAARRHSITTPFPADGTLLREIDTAQVFVVYGGARFPIPDPATLSLLGFTAGQVGVIPAGTSAQLGTVPFEGALLKELHDPRVFLVENAALRWVTSPTAMAAHCLSWRHIRTVPDATLAPLARGPDLNP